VNEVISGSVRLGLVPMNLRRFDHIAYYSLIRTMSLNIENRLMWSHMVSNLNV